MTARRRDPETPSESNAAAEADAPHRRSHREKKQERQGIEALTQRLVALRPHEREALKLDEDLCKALAELNALKGSARNRQAKFVHGILRRSDLEALEQRLERGLGSSYAPGASGPPGPAAQWLERLLEEGDPAIQALVERTPHADRQQLRQLVRTARRAPETATTRRARRALQTLVAELIDAESLT